MGPRPSNENTHHKRQVGMFKLYTRLTWMPSTVKVILAILGGDGEGCMAISKEDDNK